MDKPPVVTFSNVTFSGMGAVEIVTPQGSYWVPASAEPLAPWAPLTVAKPKPGLRLIQGGKA